MRQFRDTSNMVEFSIVCPIRNEVKLIPKTLPSFYAVKPSEVILCFDNPPHKPSYEVAKRISKKYDAPTKFLLVDRNPEYAFHQAWVRRTGFKEARSEVTLTTDIDIVLSPSIVKYIGLVGKKNIGLVSFSKISYPITLRSAIAWLVQRVYRHKSFTGLYAFSKRAWIETEDIESLKKIPRGEDTHLHQALAKKYDYLFISGTRNILLRPKESRNYQYLMGVNRWRIRKTRLWRVVVSSFLYWRPYLLLGYLKARYGE